MISHHNLTKLSSNSNYVNIAKQMFYIMNILNAINRLYFKENICKYNQNQNRMNKK